jgi:hypothetical protein
VTVTGQPSTTFGYDNANQLTSIVRGSEAVSFTQMQLGASSLSPAKPCRSRLTTRTTPHHVWHRSSTVRDDKDAKTVVRE